MIKKNRCERRLEIKEFLIIKIKKSKVNPKNYYLYYHNIMLLFRIARYYSILANL
jgi:hypothetical protein